MEMNRNMEHTLNDEVLETVSGGADDAEFKFNVGDVVNCKIGSMNGCVFYQPGRVTARSKSDSGIVYTVQMGSDSGGGLTFSGETRDFPASKVKAYS